MSAAGSKVEYYYRVESRLVSSGVDEFGNSLGPGRVSVYMLRFEVTKRTPKGVQLNVYGKRRFVLGGTRKKFACASQEDARISFEARKQKQISILRKQIHNSETAIELSKHASYGHVSLLEV